jgi:hypothetical protein
MADLTIQDVRAKYPQYSDMSDTQLAGALHQKYYSDMPQEEFNKKIGLKATPSSQKWKTAGGEPKSFTDTLIRGGLEYGGMALGGVVGSGIGPEGTIAGAALGYAGGKTVADKREEMQGKKSQPTDLERASSTGKAVVEGASMEMGGQLIGAGMQKVGQYFAKLAPKWYESALKIPPSVPKEIRDKAVQTGIKGEYLPNDQGLAKLQGDIDSTNKQISSAINQLGKAGKKIDTDSVLKRLDQLKDFYKNAPDPTPYMKQIEDIKAGILKYRGGSIPTNEAQDIKKTIYALNKKHYGEMKGLEVESNKAIARGLKEEIVKQNPVIGELNEKDSALINLEEVLERAVKRIRNYDVVKFGDTVAAVVGAAAGGPGGAAATGTAKHILELPEIKARIAFALSKAGRQIKSRRLPSYIAEKTRKAVMTEND